LAPDKLIIALAGNPNAGKTTIFNNITGGRQHVGNWHLQPDGVLDGRGRRP
jgi:ferrous iron transport protein B